MKTTLLPAPLQAVEFHPGFWHERIETNRRVTLEHEYQMCLRTGRIDAFRLDWRPGQPNQPHIFWDSDVAKWVEAACYSLATHPDKRLRRRVDHVVGLIVSAQQRDGYLNAHFTAVEPDKRWTNLRDMHELYCAGHLMEAAAAHHQATGRRELLDCLCRYADHIGRTFGPRPKRPGCCGHPEIELALVKLHHATGRQEYLNLARHFVDERGRDERFFEREADRRGEQRRPAHWHGPEYCQAHKPLRQQRQVVGHAVRAMYIYSAMADLAGLTGDRTLLTACRHLWNNVTLGKMYVTGGVGPSARNEGFTRDYDLPNDTAYAETCAAIGLVFWAWRLANLTGQGRFADVMEQTLYNGVLAGVSLDGRRFFYVNPLASRGEHHRQDWFGCSCCPTNVARLLASLGQYVYSTAPGQIWVHLYAASSLKTAHGAQPVRITQETDYPWSGQVRFVMSMGPRAELPLDLMLRIPGWCRAWTLRVNGRSLHCAIRNGYARIARSWRDGDRVELDLDMPIDMLEAHPAVAADVGRVALLRGPLVYCLEQADHRHNVPDTYLPEAAKLRLRHRPGLLGGIVAIEGQALTRRADGWSGRLYQVAAAPPRRRLVSIRAIPYCLWDNRAAGAMTVWLPRA